MPKPLNNPLSQAMDKLIRDPEILGKMRETLDEAEVSGHISSQEASSRRRTIDEIEREMEGERFDTAPSDSN